MDDQLKALFDYTKFHIGMYTTLIAGIIGIFANDQLKIAYGGMIPYIKVSIALFLLAGAAGGLIASSVPAHKNWDDFAKSRLGPWSLRWIPAPLCCHIEHTAFWLGCVIASFGLFRVL